MSMEKRIASYQVLEELSTGGHATVYRVRNTRSGRILALKVLHPHLSRDPAYLERFQREAHLASSLHHPNVIRIFEVGKERDTHFIAMQYVPLTLNHLLKDQAPLPFERAVDIAHQVCLGLEAAGGQGIVHRDVKPQNILIEYEGTVKITDFGIARAQDLSAMTRTGMVMGTPQYMPPEQAQGRQPDIRSDIYSAGVMLYQMLTGQLPFEGDTPWDVIRQHIEESPRPLSETHPEIPEGLASIVDRCLRKDPDDRYQTPLEMAQAIEALHIPFRRPDLSPAMAAGGGSDAGMPPAETLPLPGPPPWLRRYLEGHPWRGVLASAAAAGIVLLLLFPAGGLDGIQDLFSSDEGPALVVDATPTPTASPRPTATPQPTRTATPVATLTPVPILTATPVPEPTPSATPAPTPTPDSSTVAKLIDVIPEGRPVTVQLTAAEAERVGISQLELSARQEISNATLALKKLSGRPTEALPPGEVFSYLEISLRNASDATIDAATITFMVPTSWSQDHEVSPGTIALYLYMDQWEELPTSVVSQEPDTLTYTAEASSFSFFAIAGQNFPPTPTPTPTPSPTPTPVPTANETVFTFVGEGEERSEPFTVDSSPWKLRYQTSWSGDFVLTVDGDEGLRSLTSARVKAGVLYETFVYDRTGSMRFVAERVPPDGKWAVSVVQNPVVSPLLDSSPPRTSFVYSGTGEVNGPPFEVVSSPWKLLYTTSWSGPFSLQASGVQGFRSLAGRNVTSGVVYETFVYDWTGPMHFISANVPPDGHWTVWVVENPSIPAVSPSASAAGILFTFTGTGEVNSPPFQADGSPWKLLYTTSWSGPFSLRGVGSQGEGSLVNQDISAGVLHETYIYGVTGSVYLSAAEIPSDGAWSVSVVSLSESSAELPAGSPPGTVFAYTGIGQANSPPFQVSSSPWKLRYRTSWSGSFGLFVAGDQGLRSVVGQPVTGGVIQQAVVSDGAGVMYLVVSDAPSEGVWTVWVIEDTG